MQKIFYYAKTAIRAFLTCAIGVFLLLCSFGFSYSGEAKIKHDGLCEVSFSVQSNLPLAEFKEEVQTRINGYNTVAGLLPKTLKLKDVGSTSTGYEVKISTRRIDKLETSGTYELKDFKSYVEAETQTREWLDKFEKGNISSITATTLTSKIKFYRNKTVYAITPKMKDGTPITVEEMSKGKKASKDAKILVFKLLDLGGLEKVKVTFPGEINYYAGEGITMEGKKTLVLTPTSIPNAEVYDIESKQTTVKNLQGLLGYVVYDPPISPTTIVVICLSATVLIGITVLVFVKFYRDGKRIIAEQEGENNGEN